jgi:hypothetical protein
LTLSPPREISRTAVNQLALPYTAKWKGKFSCYVMLTSHNVGLFGIAICLLATLNSVYEPKSHCTYALLHAVKTILYLHPRAPHPPHPSAIRIVHPTGQRAAPVTDRKRCSVRPDALAASILFLAAAGHLSRIRADLSWLCVVNAQLGNGQGADMQKTEYSKMLLRAWVHARTLYIYS